MAATAAEVLAVRAEIMERTVELLERTKHGALARAAKARAEHLATVAAGVEGKVRYACSFYLIIFRYFSVSLRYASGEPIPITRKADTKFLIM